MKNADRRWTSRLHCRSTFLVWSFICVLSFAAASIPTATAQTLTVLYTFTGDIDGTFPDVTPIFDKAGNLYGASSEHGQLNCNQLCGNIFKIDPAGNETTLFTSNSGSQGYGISSLALDKKGVVYGTMTFGGKGLYGYVFKLNKKGKAVNLHQFPTGSADGEAPGNLILDAAGNMYGLTLQGGGTGCNGFGCGTVFTLTKKRQETNVDLSAAASAPSALLRDANGNFYGTTILGGGTGCGGPGCGTVFKIDPSGRLTVLYAFKGVPDGAIPLGQIAMDSAGNLYGTTWQGGNGNACVPSGCGTVYKIDPSGKETVIHKFSVSDGAIPEGGVILDSAGNLYGTTFAGGTNPSCQGSGCGTIFQIDSNGNETVLYSFGGGDDGENPAAGLVMDSAGNLYGAALYGGFNGFGSACRPSGCGTIFKLSPK